MNKFIDISDYNTINNYNAIPCNLLKGVIIKASEGTTLTESTLEEKYNNLKGNVNIGFYHYLTSTSDPRTQAQHFYELTKDKEMQIIPVLDVEQDNLSSIAESYTTKFLQTYYELSGQNMIIYSGRCYIQDNFSEDFCKNNIFWVADYSANDKPIIEKCNKIVAWQYTDKSNDYQFISGDVDCSILYDEDSFFIIEEKEIEIPYSDDLCNEYDGIMTLQKELNSQCFTDKDWNELEEDGVAGELTLSACPMLKMGDRGGITKWVQNKLHEALNCDLASDGIFGEQTRQAVIEFQENHSLDGDGIVGKNTWRKLLGM